jgi:L-lactate dehydrogenase complex protein LldG
MSIRDTILQNVRNNQPSYCELPAIPKFHSEQPVDLKKKFAAALKELSGEVVTEPPADFEKFLKNRFPDAKVICSTVPEYAGNRAPEDFTRWSDASSIDLTIVRSSLGVAETGSVLFSEEEFRVNSIGVFAHDIVILLDPAEIVENIHDAYGHPHFRDKAYSLLMSGPSGSADIAGTTVHPAQGVTTLTVVFWPRG